MVSSAPANRAHKSNLCTWHRPLWACRRADATPLGASGAHKGARGCSLQASRGIPPTGVVGWWGLR
eukprot:9304797-Pyramimonas_sp.AAC.1